MAFSRTPTQDTYSSQQLPLVHDYKIKPGNSDIDEIWSGLTNIIPVKEGEREWGETRAGISGTVVTNIASTLSVRGLHVWEKAIGTTYNFVVVSDGSTTYVVTSSGGAFSGVNSWTDSARTPVRFAEFIDSTNVKKLVMVTGTRGYVYTSNAAGTQITDADFPNPHVPFPVFLNGRIFLAKGLTGDIYNSALDDPTSWTAGDFISSEVYSDDIQALVKVNNYILAIGNRGSEYFFDNANASGSPLARLDGGVLPFGTAAPNSIAVLDNIVMLHAFTTAGEGVFRIIEGFKYKDVPASAVIVSFGEEVSSGGFITTSTCRGMFTRHNGELLYVFNYNGEATNAAAHSLPTFAYHLKSEKWVRFKFDEDNTYPIYFMSPANTTNPSVTIGAGTSNLCGVFFALLSTTIYEDNVGAGDDVLITQETVIPPNTFGTLNLKTMSRLGVNYAYGGVESSPLVNVQYSDDNMETYSTERTLAGTMYNGFPYITQLGAFRNRGYKIHATSAPIRWNYLEVDINKGGR